MLKPIEQHQNYFFTTGQKSIYGLTGNGVTDKLPVVDEEKNTLTVSDFFSVSGSLYFAISKIVEVNNPDYTVGGEAPEKINEEQTEYYKQDAEGIVTSITKLPSRPSLDRAQFDNGVFTIKDFNYQGTLCSDVDNIKIECGFERFLMVNGSALFDTGLFFNVAEGRPKVRKEGLYFWPVESKRCNLIRLPEGEIW